MRNKIQPDRYYLCLLLFFLVHIWQVVAINLQPFIQYPVEKIRPLQQPDTSTAATLRLAGNEYEAVVCGLYNPQSSSGIIKEIFIRRPAGSIFSCELFLLEYYTLDAPSLWFALGGTRGQWPDPLVPLRLNQEQKPDLLKASLQRAIQLPPGENRALLLDFYLEAGRFKKTETWELTVCTLEREIHYSLTLSPWTFDLPPEPSYTTACGLNKAAILKIHRKFSDTSFDGEQLYLDYLKLLARHKLFTYTPYQAGINYRRDPEAGLQFDWQDFDGLTGALLEGTLFAGVPRATSFRMPSPAKGLTQEETRLFYAVTAEHMREKGWLERMFYYAIDEPLLSDYPSLEQNAAILKAIDSGLRILITEPYTPQLTEWADIWCPDIPYLGDSIPMLPAFFKGSSAHPNLEWQLHYPPAVYKRQQAAGKELWLYTCTSAQVLGYPNLFIDSPAQYQRIIPWLMYRYGFTGFLYYSLNLSYVQNKDPWQDQYLYWTQGDGNQLYPGVPARDHLDFHQPIIALRLKILREGFEDYEYLKMLADTGQDRAAEWFNRQLVSTSLIWEHRTSRLRQTREQVGEALQAALNN